MGEDEKHLDLLSLFHYIVGGFTGFFACFPIIHVVVGAALLMGLIDNASEPEAEQVGTLVGSMFVVMGSVFILFGWTTAVCIIIAGRKLKRRESRTFCLVVAAIECFFMPLGTILGVFTIVVLTKDSVIELFVDDNQISRL